MFNFFFFFAPQFPRYSFVHLSSKMYRDHRKQVDFEGKLATGDQVKAGHFRPTVFKGGGGGLIGVGLHISPKYQH